jgi:hypothetical protein
MGLATRQRPTATAIEIIVSWEHSVATLAERVDSSCSHARLELVFLTRKWRLMGRKAGQKMSGRAILAELRKQPG